ncbi:MAG: undecaprenyl-diphosphatase UppP [Candidatus Acidiferrales bacterium]
MSLAHAIILAIVQGLTEFLPVSSSAHLILVPHFLKWADPGLAFDVALHAGTLVAVLLYFLKDWIELALAGVGFQYPRHAPDNVIGHNRRLFWYLVAGTIPGAAAGFLFEKRIEESLRDPIPIGIAMMAMGLLMWYADRVGRKQRPIEQANFGDAMSVGIAQAFALFPGVSRSGITITESLFRGMTREAAARFSFLLSTPIIAGAAVLEVPKLIRQHHAGTLDLPLSTLLISVAVSAAVGYAVIAFFLRYLQTRTLKIFVYYRIVFGIVILLLAFLPLGSAR